MAGPPSDGFHGLAASHPSIQPSEAYVKNFPCSAIVLALFLFTLLFSPVAVFAQGGNAATIHGTVTDPSGAVIPGATVHLTNNVSGLDRTTTTGSSGNFEFPNTPFNPYEISASAKGFSAKREQVE